MLKRDEPRGWYKAAKDDDTLLTRGENFGPDSSGDKNHEASAQEEKRGPVGSRMDDETSFLGRTGQAEREKGGTRSDRQEKVAPTPSRMVNSESLPREGEQGPTTSGLVDRILHPGEVGQAVDMAGRANSGNQGVGAVSSNPVS